MIKSYIQKFAYIIVLILIVIASISIYALYRNNKKLKNELSTAVSNEKAFIAENNNLKNQNIAFQFTIEQLEYFNDSLLTKINDVRKELKIKDKDIKQMQYLLSEAQKIDTIIFKDTIFINPSINIDTLLINDWYQMDLKLKYPNVIITEPKFISEKYIIVNYKKETIDPPKKCAIARWFQKKHKVVEVNIVEKSPYIENKQQKFIEIIK